MGFSGVGAELLQQNAGCGGCYRQNVSLWQRLNPFKTVFVSVTLRRNGANWRALSTQLGVGLGDGGERFIPRGR